ncbi:P27 family phage terminase small subunit [Clostridium sp. Mt-5]|uniref:P27 family phage terminase small subunit n=1 Tax=Clostridium moutaii TaxID=3240932 RepID=A0ABV4BS36_9CLOT
MGRNAKPIELLLAQGKKHLTKAEIKQRKDSELKLGNHKLICPNYIKNDVNAYKKWKEITKIYKEVDFVSSGDTGLLARYCMTHSEYINLLQRMKRISSIVEEDSDGVEDYIDNSEEFDRRIKKQLKDMVSAEAVLRLETAINKKMDMLIKMEDRLFLNPLAKVKNIPKKTSEKPKTEFDKRFGNV